jgi:CheY-like chemotaxis protein
MELSARVLVFALVGRAMFGAKCHPVELDDPRHAMDAAVELLPPPAGDYVEICVADDGSGMIPDVRAKVFEPFFTTKAVGKGSGLGLSQVLGFAQQSGGGVRIQSELGAGTRVCIYLPRAASRSVLPRSVLRVALAPENSDAKLLVVDDDSAVREVTAAMLREQGYSVVEAGSAGAALELIEADQDLDLMLVDFAMPGMNGADLVRQVQAKRPALPFVFVTGFADRTALAGVGEAQIIGKPFLDDELATKVRQTLVNSRPVNVVRLRR